MSTTKTGKQGALAVGMEVTVVGHDGRAMLITRIVGQGRGDKGWSTQAGRDDLYGRGSSWTQTGLEEAGQVSKEYRWRIVPTTDEHRRDIWRRQCRESFKRLGLWDNATAEQIEAVAKIMGIPAWDAQKEGK